MLLYHFMNVYYAVFIIQSGISVLSVLNCINFAVQLMYKVKIG